METDKSCLIRDLYSDYIKNFRQLNNKKDK